MRETFTREQAQVIEAVQAGTELVLVNAYAGAGKTHTLLGVAKSAAARGQSALYLVFNRAMRNDAKRKFKGLRGVEVKTAHSLARSILSARFNLKNRVRSYLYQLLPDVREAIPETRGCPTLGFALLRAIHNFTHTADPVLSAAHFPGEEVTALATECGFSVGDLVALAQSVWEKMSSPDGDFPLSHDTYLKILQLIAPRLDYDLVLYDEAQDVNAAMRDIVLRQPAQKVFVGDRFQSLYGWRGAENALEQLSGLRLYLTRTFRFGEALAGPVNRVLSLLGAPKPLRAAGAGGRLVLGDRPGCGAPFAVLVRSNADAVRAIRELYSSGCRKIRLHRNNLSGTVALIAELAVLRRGGVPSDPRLRPFRSWRDLRAEVEAAPAIYGELGTLSRLVERDPYPEKLVELLRFVSKVKTDEAQVIVSTVHQAKGLEWPRVYLPASASYALLDERGRLVRDEAMVLYVALTRAQRELFLPWPLLDRLGEAERALSIAPSAAA